MVNYRIGSDLDGDGFINWGVSAGTPPNLFPGALYTAKSRLVGQQYNTFAEQFSDVTDISYQGFTKRTVKMGRDIDGDYAERIQFGLYDYQLFQQHALDPDNLMGDSVGGTFLPGVTQTNGPFFSTAYWQPTVKPPYFYTFNTLVVQGFSAGNFRIGQNGTWNNFGFYDVPQQYTQAVNSVQAINGIPVTAGQTYTYLATHMPQTGPDNAYVRIYGNNGPAGTPNFGRTYIAGTDFAFAAAQKTFVAITFTVPVGVTQVMFDWIDTVGNPSQSSRVGGHMLLTGTHTHPGRMWDDSVLYNRNQFPILYEAGKSYVMSFWVKSDDGIDGLVGQRLTAQPGTANPVQTTENIPVTSEWVRHDLAIPSAAYERGVYWEWTTTKGGVATGLDNVGTVEFKGFMLTEGDTTYPYHAGVSYEYDDLTGYSLSVATQSGKNGFHESIAYEGTMEVALNNEDKLFSPANTASPFYGVLDQNRKTVLQIYDGTEWRNLWSGWSTQIGLSVGENGDNRANLTCNQGLFRLREGTFSAPLAEEVKMDDVVRLLIESSGWRSTAVPFQSTVGYDARVSENFYVLDTELMFGTFQEGINTLELVGQDWGRKGDIEAALKELLASENASFWIDRDGRIVVVNREYWVNATEPVEIVIDSGVQESDYVYGENIVNRAEVIINRKRMQTDETIWKTHRAFKVIPHKLPTDKVEIEIHAERVEGRQKTIIEYSLEGMVKTVYTADPGISYADPQTASTEQSDKVVVELMPVGGGNLYRLRVTNNNTVPMWVDIELKGNYLDTEDGTPVIVEDTEAINQQEAIHSEKITTGILSSETQAQSLGMFYVLRDAEPRGEFVSIVMRDEALGVDVEKLFDMQLGTKISITEAQTCETDSIHWIIGEDISIEGNVLIVTYTTARGMPGTYLAVGSELDLPTANLVRDWTNVYPTGHNTATYDGEKITYVSISPNSPLYLDPTPGQIVKYPLGYWEYGYIRYTDEYWGASTSKPPTRYTDEAFIVGAAGTQNYGKGSEKGGRIPLKHDVKYRSHTYGHYAPSEWVNAALDRYMDATGNHYQGHSSNDQFGTGITRTAVTANGFNGNTTGLLANYIKAEWTMPAASLYTVAGLFPLVSQPMFYFTMAYYPTVSGQIDQASPLTLVQMSGLKNGTTIDTTVSHKYSLFAAMDANFPDRNQMCVLTVYNGDTGAVIGTHSQEILPTTQKWEVSIPSGVQNVWATFEQTPFIGSYSTDNPLTNLPSTTIYITGYGVTTASVTDVAELNAAQDYPVIYP